MSVSDELDARDLERRGWTRDAQSAKDANWRSSMLRKAADAQDQHTLGAGDSSRKRELGEIEIDLDGTQRRIRVALDPGTLSLHGVNLRTSEVQADLMRAVETTAAALNAAQNTEEQATQRTLLGALIDRVLRRHKFAADAVARQLHHERFVAI